MSDPRPRLAITLGDVAGIGPEIVVRAVTQPDVMTWCRPVIIGHPELVRRTARSLGIVLELEEHEFDSTNRIVCCNPGTDDVLDIVPGCIQAAAGRAAYDYLVAATRATLRGEFNAIVTAPLHKEALRAAGVPYPGHTEILAAECGIGEVAMMLYLPADDSHIDALASPAPSPPASGERVGVRGRPRTSTSADSAPDAHPAERPAPSPYPSPPQTGARGPNQILSLANSLGVAHVTLHTSIRSVPGLLTTARVADTVRLLDRFLRDLGGEPRIGVTALNPHAGEHGLFGDEEGTIIAPAVELCRREGINATGPIPADALIRRAVAGEFDGVAAMYHDQGHIPLKLIGRDRAVNVTLGLPIIRTSPSHGTAFDIVGQGTANPEGLLAAMRVACRLAGRWQDLRPARVDPHGCPR
ncbi:MAG TPA: 4-hydroxythreonine-4-phosphate dehydrogenase PdxA, partial [Planctomycetaceae bacterium]|nr:4-hydroxythreonine-4-phosphate dehydrogenase PdxA [Planctomycetaceae bacterium]